LSLNRLRNKLSGFTLLEILVALAIVAVGLVAVSRSLNTSLLIADALDNRTIADWVAENQLEELKIAGTWPPLGEVSSTSDMADRPWYIERRVSSTLDSELRRVDVAIYEDQDHKKKLVNLFGYVSHDQQLLRHSDTGQ